MPTRQIKGPNGKASVVDKPFILSHIKPPMRPNMEADNSEGKTHNQPKLAPRPANNLASPMPMPSFLAYR